MEGRRIKTIRKSLDGICEYVRRLPDIRGHKVREMRRRISSGSWNPKSKRIAEKILDEHLFDPEPSN